jgi:hypothetical protein
MYKTPRKEGIGKKGLYSIQSMALEYLVRCLCIRRVGKSSHTWCQWSKNKNNMLEELVSERKVAETGYAPLVARANYFG